MSLSQVLSAGADLRAAALHNELDLWVAHTGGTSATAPKETAASGLRQPIRTGARQPVSTRRGRGTTASGTTRALTRPLSEQTSQILLLRDVIGGLLSRVDQHAAGDDIVAARKRGEGIHAVHLVWDFFRDQLAQRMDDDLRLTLTLADDLAEACYRPAVKAAGGGAAAFRQPPLVHFASRPSPFVWPRNNVFVVSAHLQPSWQDFFANTLHDLPIPVIGLPWGDAWHLAGMVSIAHEVGHCVYDDLGLAQQAVADLSGFPGADHLRAWASECFADLWGVLGCGVPYVELMAGVLVGSPQKLATEHRDDGSTPYPTAMLRMHMLLSVARALGLDVTQVAAEWQAQAPATHELAELESISGDLVRSWLDNAWTALDGGKLADILQPPTDTAIQRFASDQVIAGRDLQPSDKDARLFAAGLGRAWFSQPAAYAALEDNNGAGRKRLLEQFGQRRSAVVRSVHGASPSLGHRAADVDRVANHMNSFLDALEPS